MSNISKLLEKPYQFLTDQEKEILAKYEEESEQIELTGTGGEDAASFNQVHTSDHHVQSVTPLYAAAHVQEKFNEELGILQKKISAKRSTLIHNLIHLNGSKFDFSGRNYLKPIYDTDHKHILLRTGRQVEKSTMNSNRLVIDSVVRPYFKCLYVSPSHMQTRQFSADKLKPARETSPLIKKFYIDNKVSDQVFEKGYKNGAMNYLRSCFLTADRARGISADLLLLDEIQDIILANVPVIAECLSHSKYGYQLYTGTPKTEDNTIEMFWQGSSQCEWLVPCRAHSPVHYNFLTESNIGKHGPICDKCGKKINPAEGQWIAFSAKNDIMGFRISQIMVPWMYEDPDKWKGLLWKYENYAKSLFYNECLGLPYDSALKPITKTQLMASCGKNLKLKKHPDETTKNYICFGGVDWGEGNDGSERDQNGKLKAASYTILTLGTYMSNGRFFPFYMRRFTGKEADPDYCYEEIVKVCKAFRVQLLGVDWGHGWGLNERLEKKLGIDRVVKFAHVGKQKERRRYDPVGGKMLLSRNQLISELFEDIKSQKIQFPNWAEFEPFAKDILSVYQEYNEYLRTIKYDHRYDQPDDFMHSLIYAREAGNIYYGRNGRTVVPT